MSTASLSAKQIQRSWVLIDAKDQILGRLATSVAKILMGKKKSNFVPYLDMGDNVVIINSDKVKVTGKKALQKIYFRHSGYPGGDKRETLAKLRERKPQDIIIHAVSGMLPKNRLGKERIKRLHVFEGEKHSFKDKF